MKSKARIRTKTGCLACRKRRKKCDEVKPICAGCSRNFLECTWPSPSGLQHAQTRQPSCLPTTSTTVPDVDPSRQRGLMQHQTIAGAVCWNSSPLDREPPLRIAPNSATLYRQRGNRISQSQSSRRPTTSYAESPSLMLSNGPNSMSPHSSLLLQHYLEETSAFLVAKPAQFNPYVTIVVPLAYSDDLLMHAVLALSGTQLSFRKARDYHIHLATRRHYSEALRMLDTIVAQQSVCEDVQRALRIALVSLILCYVEVSSQWKIAPRTRTVFVALASNVGVFTSDLGNLRPLWRWGDVLTPTCLP